MKDKQTQQTKPTNQPKTGREECVFGRCCHKIDQMERQSLWGRPKKHVKSCEQEGSNPFHLPLVQQMRR